VLVKVTVDFDITVGDVAARTVDVTVVTTVAQVDFGWVTIHWTPSKYLALLKPSELACGSLPEGLRLLMTPVPSLPSLPE